MSNFAPDLNSIIDVMQAKGYRVYTNEEGFDLNIVGVRTDGRLANRFDDWMTVFYRQHGTWIFNRFPCTTDPGAYWLEHPMNMLGTAILKEGQYRSAYEIGKHRGQYRALVQKSPVTVYRDPDKDNILDIENAVEETGLFGINIHRASRVGASIQVDKWSAGCQVICDAHQFNFFMDVCQAGANAFGNSFTYTLLHERDF